jgi:hypothetical protein
VKDSIQDVARTEVQDRSGDLDCLEDHRKPHLRLVNIQVDVRPIAQLARRTEMHHVRGKLFQGDKVCLDPANVYVDY